MGQTGRPITVSLEERFWDRVELGDGPNDCWNWTGSLRSDGYGQFRYKNRRDGNQNIRAHLLALRLAGIPLTDEMVHHVCGNRRCVNPDHLEQMDRSTHTLLHIAQRRGVDLCTS